MVMRYILDYETMLPATILLTHVLGAFCFVVFLDRRPRSKEVLKQLTKLMSFAVLQNQLQCYDESLQLYILLATVQMNDSAWLP